MYLSGYLISYALLYMYNNAYNEARTHDLRLIRPMLYPTEL